MNISQAVALRIIELLKEKGISQYRLEQQACLSHDPVKSIIKGKAKGVNLRTVISIADGFGMSVSEFLNSELFNIENLNLNWNLCNYIFCLSILFQSKYKTNFNIYSLYIAKFIFKTENIKNLTTI